MGVNSHELEADPRQNPAETRVGSQRIQGTVALKARYPRIVPRTCLFDIAQSAIFVPESRVGHRNDNERRLPSGRTGRYVPEKLRSTIPSSCRGVNPGNGCDQPGVLGAEEPCHPQMSQSPHDASRLQ